MAERQAPVYLPAMRHATSTVKKPRASPVGQLIKQWRERRRLSQLSLAVDAEISTRHLSFIETGRSSQPRHVLLLARALEVPRADATTCSPRRATARSTGRPRSTPRR